MPAPDQVVQGENYNFSQTLGTDTDEGGSDVGDFTYQLDVKQFPDDSAIISKPLVNISGATVTGSLTPAETATLEIGLWYLIITSTDPNENIQELKRIQVTKTWVPFV